MKENLMPILVGEVRVKTQSIFTFSRLPIDTTVMVKLQFGKLYEVHDTIDNSVVDNVRGGLLDLDKFKK